MVGGIIDKKKGTYGLLMPVSRSMGTLCRLCGLSDMLLVVGELGGYGMHEATNASYRCQKP